ncbi:MAG: heavy metal-associated domain-containing protein [Bacteroidales bacterium]|jgi:copper chaperone CopZ|nr:heavy metal-associated domain-containing protein [Bacteroidales bacterium]
MKTKHLIIFIGLLIISYQLQAQQTENKKKKTEIVTIQTSGHCQSCKDIIETGLAFEKGIKDVAYDISTTKVTVIFNPKKTNVDIIKKRINELGYDADDFKVNNQSVKDCKQEDNHRD